LRRSMGKQSKSITPVKIVPRGRPFENGNPGRKPGSRNRTTAVAEALLRGEEVELVRKAIELAKSGDPPMLKFLLDRILPRDRPVQVTLPPLDCARDASEAIAELVRAVAEGRIAPSEGAAVAQLISAYYRALDVAELQAQPGKGDRPPERPVSPAAYLAARVARCARTADDPAAGVGETTAHDGEAIGEESA
jgi:hypothetical protein